MWRALEAYRFYSYSFLEFLAVDYTLFNWSSLAPTTQFQPHVIISRLTSHVSQSVPVTQKPIRDTYFQTHGRVRRQEFVHGDLGRTRPSMRSFLNGQANDGGDGPTGPKREVVIGAIGRY